MTRFILIAVLVAITACSPDPQQALGNSDDQTGAEDKPKAAFAKPAAKSSTPIAGFEGIPTTKVDGSPLDAEYCLKTANEPGSPFFNTKTCVMISCRTGDQPSCELAETYNGNLWADGEPTKTLKLEEMDYFSARKVILGFGWVPLAGPCQGGGVGDVTCRQFPEIGYCQGTGPAFCDMHFSRANRCLVVVTKGGPPDSDGPNDSHVEHVNFGPGPCSKGTE